MHYLNLLTIRLYTLLAILPNYLPNWLRHGMTLVKVPYNIDSWSNFNGETIKQMYHSSSGSQIAKFYIYFSKYLRGTRPMYTIVSHIGGHVAEFMYDVANDMEKIYIHLFSMFGFISQQGEVQRWYRYIQYVGGSVFFLLLVIYGVGMIFNMHGGFARMKDLISGMLIATAIIFLLPWFTRIFSVGLEKTADAVLGNPRSAKTSNTIVSGNKNDPHGESLADSIVKNNVISIPSVTTYSAMRGISDININQHPDIFQPTHQQFSGNIPSQPYFINLYHMQDNTQDPNDITQQKDVWNGIGTGSTGQFLGNIGGDGSYLDKATINHNTKFIRKNIGDPSFYGGMNIWANKQAYGMEKGLMAIPAFFGSKHAQQIRKDAQGNIDTAKYQNDVATRVYAPYKYHIQGNGDDAEFTEFNQFGGDDSFLTGFRASYGTYQVNWFNIFLGLLTIICMMIGLLIKLSNGFYKMLVMYVSSAWFLMKNSAHHDKIKDFIRAFLGIFENLIIDILILRLFVIAFIYVNSFVAQETVVPLSPIAIGLVQAALSYGLFKVESQGIDTLSSQLSGQGNKTGNGLGTLSTLGALNMGLHGVGHAAMGTGRMATHGASKGIKSAGRYGKGAVGGWQREKAKMHGGNPGSKNGKKLRNGINEATGQGSPSNSGSPTAGSSNDTGSGLMTGTPTTLAGKAGATSGFFGRKFAANARHHADPNYHGFSLNRHGGNAFHPGHVNGKKSHYMGKPQNNPNNLGLKADNLAKKHHNNMRNNNKGHLTNQLRHHIGPRPAMNVNPLDHHTNVSPKRPFTEFQGFQGKNNTKPASNELNANNDDNNNNEDDNNNDDNDDYDNQGLNSDSAHHYRQHHPEGDNFSNNISQDHNEPHHNSSDDNNIHQSRLSKHQHTNHDQNHHQSSNKDNSNNYNDHHRGHNNRGKNNNDHHNK